MDGCQTCNDPTKYMTGFWDGANNKHGQIFDCRNQACHIKQSRVIAGREYLENVAKTAKANINNGIFTDLIKAKRVNLKITIREMSEKLGVKCSQYCDYEQCREPIPVEVANKINQIFGSEANNGRTEAGNRP